MSLASWKQRQQRALKLLTRRPQAAPLLECYVELLDLQREIAVWVSQQDWAGDGAPLWAAEGEYPRLRWRNGLPVDDLVTTFTEFVPKAAEGGTAVMQKVAALLAHSDSLPHGKVLVAFLQTPTPTSDSSETGTESASTVAALVPLAQELGCDPRQLAFFPRAYMVPILETLAAKAAAPPEPWEETFCPTCGGAPRLAVLLDEKLIKNRRLLECSLCSTRWPIRRGICVQCGEQEAEPLQFHTVEDLPHVRLDTCSTCNAYLKTIDLRRDGLSIPVVDELATVELDLWADEQGLWKITPNLLGV